MTGRTVRRAGLVALALGLATPGPTRAQVLLVSPQWLRARLGTPELVVLHAGMERAEYDGGHLPGARFAQAMEFHAHEGGLPPVGRLVAQVEALGVGNGSRVVITGDPMSAAILFVALDYLGHGERTSVLDGGLAAWREAGGEVSTRPVTPARAAFAPAVRSDLVVTADWVRDRLHAPGIALLDARSTAEFAGTTDQEKLPRFGHIPGAGHLDWVETFAGWRPGAQEELRSTLLLPVGTLRERFAAAGAVPGDTVVTYCTVGMRASHLYLVARHLGFPARLYLGSMADWSRRSDLPVEP